MNAIHREKHNIFRQNQKPAKDLWQSIKSHLAVTTRLKKKKKKSRKVQNIRDHLPRHTSSVDMICLWQFIPAPASVSLCVWLHGEMQQENEKLLPPQHVPCGFLPTAKIPVLAQAGADRD